MVVGLKFVEKKKMRNWFSELNIEKGSEEDYSFLSVQNKTINEMHKFIGLDIQKTLLIAAICVLQQRKGALIIDIYLQFEDQYDPRYIDFLIDELKADNWIKSHTEDQEEYLLLRRPVQLALKKSNRQLLPKNDANPRLQKIRYLCMIAREFKRGNKTLYDWENSAARILDDGRMNITKYLNKQGLSSIEKQVGLFVVCHYINVQQPIDSSELAELFSTDPISRFYFINHFEINSQQNQLTSIMTREFNMRSGYGYLPSRPFLETCLPGLLTSVETIQNEALLPMPVDEFKPKQLFYNEDNLRQIQQLEQILEPLNQSNYQKLIAETENSCGITVLLSGGPGVGKTELARQLALKTKRELYIFQPSQQRSKWFGDTEKNIQRVFEDYRKTCTQSEITPILFFNEADSIIHKRSDNGSFTSQTENAVLTILLQELEQFDGILICTTNRPDTFDEAFDRRFLFKIHIDEPEQQTRATLLGHYFRQLSELEIDHLSAYPFTAAELDNFKRQQLISRLAQQESKNMAQDLESFLLHLHKNKRQNKIGYYEN